MIQERFDIRRCLGSGAFGAVYEAYDRTRGARVALKELVSLDASALYRFKEEFRGLRDITHDNLVGLHELFCVEGRWYLTMDLVEGADILSYLRGPAAPAAAAGPPAPAPPADPDRLRLALAQLARGVMALHRAGRLHRDLKPQNIAVTPEGRVVILDFGLLGRVAARDQSLMHAVGTPAYMAPEILRDEPATEAADWYAVGCILYEALAGPLPFSGAPLSIARQKQERDGPDPRDLCPDAPADLSELCAALLRRDPALRPGGAEILRRLGDAAAPPPAPPPGALPFVGREPHLAALHDAYLASRRGRAIVVHLHGASGMGKSGLGRRFLDELAAREPALVALEGRCYEREAVPYKALDALVDGLCRHLLRLDAVGVAALLPRDAVALGRLFPVLLRVERIAAAPDRDQAPDPHELRRRGFAALRELLARLGDRAPLVLLLDDLQWGDRDSAALLEEILKAPDAPAMLLLCCYRSEDAGAGELLPRLPPPDGDAVREVEVGPLSADEAQELARRLLADEPGDAASSAAAVAREAGGSPFFVQEVVRHVRRGHIAGDISLGEVVAARLRELPDEARRLLEITALCGRPVRARIAARVAGLDTGAERAALSLLRSASLIRSCVGEGPEDVEEIETYHDRIRDCVSRAIDPAELPARHAALAAALEAADADPEALGLHFRAAGDPLRAGDHMRRAAERAVLALAFDRAAALYRSAIDLVGPEEAAALRGKLADALADAGRGAEAGRAYLTAAEAARGDEALRARQRAAEQLLRSGRIDEGLAAARGLLTPLGLSLPSTPARALASLLSHRLRLRLRGLGRVRFTERREEDIPRGDLHRIDVCWALGNGLGGVDTFRGADFQARHLLLALRAGEPYRIARALAWEAILVGIEGNHGRAAELVAESAALAGRIGHPHALAWAEACAAITAWLVGRFRDARDGSERTIQLFREACRDISWEVGSMYVWWLLPAQLFLGELPEVARRTPLAIREAQDLGDLYGEVSLRTYMMPYVHMAADRPEEAHRDSADAIASWSQEGWHLQHWCDHHSRAQASLYEGDGRAALDRTIASWRPTERSLLMRSQMLFTQSHYLRGRAALLAARQGGDRAALEAEAGRMARRLRGVGTRWARAYGRSLDAGLLARRGRTGEALARWSEAIEDYEALEMAMHVAAAHRRRGELSGGDAGRDEVTEADRWLAGRGVRDPARMAAMLLP